MAWQAGRSTERRARGGESAPPSVTAAVAPEQSTDPAPSEPDPLPAPAESEATLEVPILDVDERPAAEPAPPRVAPYEPPEDRPRDTPGRCVMIQANPSTVSAYGRSGEIVQLVVRGQNGCGTNFGSVYFRAIAIGPDGREVASAVGRFPDGISAGGSAETLIAIATKPVLGMSYRAEPQ